MRSFLNKSLLGTAAIVALGLVTTPNASADVNLAYVGGEPVVVDGGFRYDYTVTLLTGFSISPGTLATGPGIGAPQSEVQGTTLFDFLGLVGSGTFTPAGTAEAAGASFAVTSVAFGTQAPSAPESGALNVDAIYNGTLITATEGTGPIVLGVLSAVSTSNLVISGANPFSSTSENDTNNFAATNQSAASGPGLAPAIVPEANAGLLAGLALPLIGGVAILRRRKK